MNLQQTKYSWTNLYKNDKAKLQTPDHRELEFPYHFCLVSFDMGFLFCFVFVCFIFWDKVSHKYSAFYLQSDFYQKHWLFIRTIELYENENDTFSFGTFIDWMESLFTMIEFYEKDSFFFF